jgi:uncharacterized protein (TIGR00251 family)
VSDGREGAVLRVHVVPGSRTPGIDAVDRWRGALVVRVAARAEQGRANEELVERLATALSVEGSRVLVDAGHRSREKAVVVRGLTSDEVRRRLGVTS